MMFNFGMPLSIQVLLYPGTHTGILLLRGSMWDGGKITTRYINEK